MPANTAEYTLLTPANVAKRLSISESTLRRWRCEGVGPRHIKLQGHVRYRSDDLEKYLDEALRSSTHG